MNRWRPRRNTLRTFVRKRRPKGSGGCGLRSEAPDRQDCFFLMDCHVFLLAALGTCLALGPDGIFLPVREPLALSMAQPPRKAYHGGAQAGIIFECCKPLKAR